jgi:anti-sigma-K factor RskA
MRIATLNAQTEAYAKVLAVVVWDEDKQQGVVKLDQLARPAADRDYQLWMIDPNRVSPVSAGILSVDEDGLAQASFKPSKAIRSVNGFAVSIERKGGASVPEGPIILMGK